MGYTGGGQRAKNPDKIGALWISKDDDGNVRKDKNGNAMLGGTIEVDGQTIKVNVIKNSFKEEDKQPDYVIMKRAEGGASKPKKGSDVPF